MAISAINITRTSFNLQTLSLLDSLRQNTLKIFLEQNRLATGNRITAPSDDPVGAGSAVRMTEILDRQEQILANIKYADGFLSATDNAVSEISRLLTDAHSIALEMVNSFSSQEQRDSMAEVVKSIIQELVMVGNRTFGDVYLFGGRKTDSVPFSEENGGVVYRGDTKSLTAHVDRFLDAPFNISGDELFGSLSGKVTGWVDLDPSLTGDTRLVDMGGTTGRGIDTSGLLRISLDVPAVSFTVDLSNADTAQNVIDMINDAAARAGLNVGPGLDFNASYNPSLNGFQIDVGAGNVSVQDVGGGVTGRDLGLVGTAAGSLVGADLQPRLVPMTTVASLFGGAGAALGSIIITNDNLTATVDLSSAVTIQDILNAVGSAGVKVKAQINEAGTGLDVINLVSGLEMRIGEAGDGSGTAEVRSPSAMRSVTSEACARGRRMERDSSQAQARLSNRPTSEPAASSVCLGVRCARRPHGPLPRAGAGIRPACSPLPHRHQPQAAAGWQWRPAAKPRPPCGALRGHPAPCESHCQPCRWRRIAPETPHLPPAHPGACALQRNGPTWLCGRRRCAWRKLGCQSLAAFPRGRS